MVFTDLADLRGGLVPAVSVNHNVKLKINFGQQPLAHRAPDGYKPVHEVLFDRRVPTSAAQWWLLAQALGDRTNTQDFSLRTRLSQVSAQLVSAAQLLNEDASEDRDINALLVDLLQSTEKVTNKVQVRDT